MNADSSVQILAEEAVSLDKLDAAVSLNSHSQYHWVIVLPLSLCVCVQAARQGLDRCTQQSSSASNEADRAEAQVGVELYETVLKALEGQ